MSLNLTSIIPVDTLIQKLSEKFGGSLSLELEDLESLTDKAKEVEELSKTTVNEKLKETREKAAEEIKQAVEDKKKELLEQKDKMIQSMKKMVSDKIEEAEKSATTLSDATQLVATSVTTWTTNLTTSIPLISASVVAAIDPGSKAGVLSSIVPTLTTIKQNISSVQNILNSASGAVKVLKDDTDFLVDLLDLAGMSSVSSPISAAVNTVTVPFEAAVDTIGSIFGEVSGAADSAESVAESAKIDADKIKYETILNEAVSKLFSGVSIQFSSKEIADIKEAFEFYDENKIDWESNEDYIVLHRRIYNK